MDLEHESKSLGAKTPDNLPGFFGALRSRYYVFIENYRERANANERTRFGQKVINSAIFFVLLIAILIVFGIGLSWIAGSSQIDHANRENQPATKSAGDEAPAALPSAPAQPAGPAGHAEVRPQSAPEKKTDGK